LLPKKTKRTSFQPTASVVASVVDLKRLSAEYHQAPTVLKKVSLKLAKRELDEAYLLAEADFINGKISDIESLHISKQHHAAWKTISQISGKRSSQQYASRVVLSPSGYPIGQNTFKASLELSQNCLRIFPCLGSKSQTN
jgi:hypothetical protein